MATLPKGNVKTQLLKTMLMIIVHLRVESALNTWLQKAETKPPCNNPYR